MIRGTLAVVAITVFASAEAQEDAAGTLPGIPVLTAPADTPAVSVTWFGVTGVCSRPRAMGRDMRLFNQRDTRPS